MLSVFYILKMKIKMKRFIKDITPPILLWVIKHLTIKNNRMVFGGYENW